MDQCSAPVSGICPDPLFPTFSLSPPDIFLIASPVFGGLLNQHLGWRFIFWFLAILVVCALVPFTLFFPETLRSIRGNGAVPATGISRTLWELVKGEEKCQRSEEEVQAGQEVRKKALEGEKNANPVS